MPQFSVFNKRGGCVKVPDVKINMKAFCLDFPYVRIYAQTEYCDNGL